MKEATASIEFHKHKKKEMREALISFSPSLS